MLCIVMSSHFLTMRKYKYLNKEKVHKSEVAYGLRGIAEKYVFQRSSTDICYFVCDTIEEFYAHYSKKNPSSRTYFEVINDNFSMQKFKIDVDGKIGVDEMKYLLRIMRRLFRHLTKIKPEVLVYDISTSHHIVVANLCFTAACCEIIAGIIREKILKRYPIVASLIDTSVYKKVQMFRIEGSTKYAQRRWKYLTGTKNLSALEIFKKGIISYVEDCYYIDEDKVIDIALDIGVYEHAVKKDSRHIKCVIPREFVVREVKGNLTILDRITPSYCNCCDRVHNKDGAYLVGKKFYCRRY